MSGEAPHGADARWMRRCLELAARARGRTSPNPMVGAVIVRDGRVLAEGWHHAPGLAHAEVDALSQVDGSAAGATMYVNLEPCCHHGRTPPCTDAILRSGVRRVVVGMVDPFPQVSGKGIALLRDAGLQVDVGVEESAARELNLGFVRAQEQGRPAVLLKAGLSLDGRIADAFGHSRFITSPQARAAGHALRDACDAILVGRGTLQADDPVLTARDHPGGRDPLPVVLDSDLSIADNARLLRGPVRPLLFCGPEAPHRELAADVIRVPRGPAGLDLNAVLTSLLARGVHTLLVEGGGRVHRSFLDRGLVDRLHLFVAPMVLAGGPGWIGGEPFSLGQAPRFRVCRSQAVGPDLHLVLQPEEEELCSAES